MSPPRSYQQIETAAQTFLASHHPELTLPVPIDEILEFDLDIHLTPIPGIKKLYKVDGYLTHDLKELVIDDYSLENYYPRIRFTIAHEISHLELHRNHLIQVQGQIKSEEDWKQYYNQIIHNNDILELEANQFAGFVLMPTQALASSLGKWFQKIRKQNLANISREIFFDLAGKSLAREFHVSPRAASIRIERWLERNPNQIPADLIQD